MSHRGWSARLLGIAASSVFAGLALTACGIPTGDDTFSEIPNEDVLFGLDATTTTTSTTTTTTPVTPVTTLVEPTTTIVPYEQVDVYFLSRGRLQPVALALTSDFAPEQLVDKLEEGPPPGVGLDSHIESGLIRSIDKANGVVTVDLDPEIFQRIAAFDQAEAIGQIVLTLTGNLRGVGSVRFTLGGEPTQVKKGDSLLSEPDQAVTFDDYAMLLTTSGPTSTSTTTEVPVTTVAADTVAPAVPPDQSPPSSPGG